MWLLEGPGQCCHLLLQLHVQLEVNVDGLVRGRGVQLLVEFEVEERGGGGEHGPGVEPPHVDIVHGCPRRQTVRLVARTVVDDPLLLLHLLLHLLLLFLLLFLLGSGTTGDVSL